jgi:molybdopterin-guanine dinucleotide biosynthesis protein
VKVLAIFGPTAVGKTAVAVAAAEALRELMGRSLTPAQLAAHDRDVATARKRLDPESFAAAWAEGRTMTLEQAIAYALNEASSA